MSKSITNTDSSYGLILTRDFAEARICAAHHLEQAIKGENSFTGVYRSAPIALLPLSGAERLLQNANAAIYIGRCSALTQNAKLYDVVCVALPDTGGERMMRIARSCGETFGLKTIPCILGTDVVSEEASEFFTVAGNAGLSTLALLAVESENGEICQDTDWRLPFEISAQLAFETLSAFSGIEIDKI